MSHQRRDRSTRCELLGSRLARAWQRVRKTPVSGMLASPLGSVLDHRDGCSFESLLGASAVARSLDRTTPIGWTTSGSRALIAQSLHGLGAGRGEDAMARPVLSSK